MFEVEEEKVIGCKNTAELLFKKMIEVIEDEDGMNKLQVECIICLTTMRLLLLSPENNDKCKLVLDNIYDTMVDLSDTFKEKYDEFLKKEGIDKFNKK